MRRKATKQSPAATALQKRYRQQLMDMHPGQVVHHIFGSSMKSKAAGQNIGEWAIIAMFPGDHERIHEAGKSRKPTEKVIFDDQRRRVEFKHGKIIPEEVVDAVMSWHL